MRRSLFFVLSIVCSASSFAKTTKTSAIAPYPHFNNQAGGTAPIGTSVMRLRSKSKSYFKGGSFALADSFTYFYHGQNAGIPDLYDLNDDDIRYDSSFTYTYQQSGYSSRMQRIQNYIGNNVDSLELHPYKNGGFKDSLVYIFSYQGTTILHASVMIYQANGSYLNNMVYANSVNAQGNVTAMNGVNYHIYFTYNSLGLLETQYDFNGSSTAPAYIEKDSFLYNAQQRITTYYRQKWSVSVNSWVNNEVWNYTYSTGSEVTAIEKLQWNGSSYRPYLKQLYTYNNQGYRTGDETQEWSDSANNYVKTKKLIWVYNDANLPVSLTSYTWNNSTWASADNDYQVRYWYDVVYPASVKTISNIASFSLYPVPANSSVNILLSWKEMQPFSLTIRDMNGRVVKQWEEAKTIDYNKNIPLDNVANGQYFLTIQGINSEPFTQKLIVAR